MKYMGSKLKIANEILEVILKDRKEEQYYVEPFVGGCNIIDKVKGNRIGSDINKYLIALWQGLQQNRPIIRDISKELYSKARTEYNNNTNIEFDNFSIGWIGFMASFNGRFFDGGYCGDYKKRDYISEQIKNTLKQVKYIQNVEFKESDYRYLNIPEKSIIYCDIPYKGKKEYTENKFDYNEFWEWCRQQNKKGHKIYISECEAPEDFVVVWQKRTVTTLNPTKTLSKIEKLFTL